MIRTAIAAAVAAASLSAGSAVAQSYSSDDLGGIVVEGQPRDAYIIRVSTAGKTDAMVRREIRDVAWIACSRAPSTGSPLDNRPNQLQWCANQAASDALAQFSEMTRARRNAFVDVSSLPPY